MENPTEILESSYQKAKEKIENGKVEDYLDELSDSQKEWVKKIVNNAEKQKGVLTVLITSLVKKLKDPQQDVRYHQGGLPGGYSGRTLDTKFVTPFIKQKFRRFAMAEAGWLTRTLEQSYPYNLDYPGSIQKKGVKDAFLRILHDIEEGEGNPKLYLTAIFMLLIEKIETVQSSIIKIDFSEEMPIVIITEMLENHFFEDYDSHGASRLPVIAIYSIYELLVEKVDRYINKQLLPLQKHTSSDIKAKRIGDIEVKDEDGNYFEVVEVKHKKPIDKIMIEDAYEKFKKVPLKRYLFLTTEEPNVEWSEKKKVQSVIIKIHKEHGCQVIPNGIIPTLKYYLRLLEKPSDFVKKYTKNLKKDFQMNTDLKREHIEKWREISKQEI